MLNLKSLQVFIQDAIYSTSWQPSMEASIKEHLLDIPGRSAIDSLKIYREMFSTRVWDSLVDDYPITLDILGEEVFSKLCEDYITSFPSQSYTLEKLGDHFYQYICDNLVSLDTEEYLPDVVYYEKSKALAFHNNREHSIDMSELAPDKANEWMNKVLRLASHVQLLALRHDISELVEYFDSDKGLSQYKVQKIKSYLLVYSFQDEICVKKIDSSSYEFLHQFNGNKVHSFGDIIDQFLAQESDQANQSITSQFPQWIYEGIIVYTY